MNTHSRKQLWVPIVTPVIGENLVPTKVVKQGNFTPSLRDNGMDTSALKRLIQTIGADVDAILPAWSTGEGDQFDLPKWKEIVTACLEECEGKPVIPAVMWADTKEKIAAIEWFAEELGSAPPTSPYHQCIALLASELTGPDTNPAFFEAVSNLLPKYPDMRLALYCPVPHKASGKEYVWIGNEQLVALCKHPRLEGKVVAIKDAREFKPRADRTLAIDELISALQGTGIAVLQGWENMYMHTQADVAGGVFPLANLEPRLCRKYLDVHQYDDPPNALISHTVKRLYQRYCFGSAWILSIKDELYRRPFSCKMDSKSFIHAFDKLFSEYSKEATNNIHVSKFDDANPLASMTRTLFSDLISFQTMFFRWASLQELLFLPVYIQIWDTVENRHVQFVHFAVGLERQDDGRWDNIVMNGADCLQACFRADTEFGHCLNNYDIENQILSAEPDTEIARMFRLEDRSGNPEAQLAIRANLPFKKFQYEYQSEEGKSNLRTVIGYVQNPNCISGGVPDWVFKNLINIAVFTKRNKLAKTKIENASKVTAVTKLLSRNFGHNIGAHVLGRTTIVNLEKRLEQLDPSISPAEKLIWLNDVRTKLDRFILDRNDFLVDPAKPLKHLFFYRDIVLPFVENTLVMDNIAASERICFRTDGQSNRLVVRTFLKGMEVLAKYGGGGMNYPGWFPYYTKEARKEKKIVFQTGEDAQDILVAVPHEHAFYSILENVIRNAAKHQGSKLKDNEDLVITISIDENEENPGTYTVEISDNVSGMSPQKLAQLKDRAETPILNSNDELTTENLGFLDMRVNAYLLAGRADYYKAMPDHKVFNLGNSDRLSYFLTIPKPQFVWAIGRFCEELTQEEKEALVAQGIRVFRNIADWRSNTLNSTSSAEFAILDGHMLKAGDGLQEFLYRLPGRVMVCLEPEDDKSMASNLCASISHQVLMVKGNPFSWPRGMHTIEQFGARIRKECWELWSGRQGKQVELTVFTLDHDEPLHRLHNCRHDGPCKFRYWELGEYQAPTPSIRQAVYNHHGTIQVPVDSEYRKMRFGWEHTYLYFDGHSLDYPIIRSHSEKDEVFLAQLVEAAFTRITIIDERLAAYAMETSKCDELGNWSFSPREFTKLQVGFAANVHICTQLSVGDRMFQLAEADKNAPQIGIQISMDPHSDSILGVNCKLHNIGQSAPTLKEDYRADVLIIHRTYLNENVIGIDTDQDKFLKELHRYFSCIVLTSGGGQPHNISSKRFKFMDYNAVRQHFGDRISKIRLVQALQLLRRLS